MTALHEIREQLAAVKGLGGFATRRTHSAGDLYLDVQGVGPIRLPVSQATARRLAASARPARYGLKDQTLYDSRVRDTGEIPKACIRLDRSSWNRTLQPMLERLRRDLGLADGVRLTAALHKMLVYGPGQFFASHQDSEKTDDMLGTLLVLLPSRYSGGALLLEHHDERLTYRGSSRRLTFIAFYADCHHEVRPVTSGHRIVLTYTLAATGEGRGTEGTVPEDQMDRLTRSVQAYFETLRPPRWSGDTRRERPDRLVYLMDHQYTPRGLAWSRLKSADLARAGALREVARRMDCEISLALADVHESWSCEDDGGFSGRRARDRWQWRRQDSEDDDASEEFELIDLLDSGIELRHWVPLQGRLDGVSASVDEAEVCFTMPSNEFPPFASEHEGYMGNYGNTVDRWYHRAAVVLWPRERTFVMHARMSPRWAVDEIAGALRQGDVDRARDLSERLTPFWREVAPTEQSRGFFERTLHGGGARQS